LRLVWRVWEASGKHFTFQRILFLIRGAYSMLLLNLLIIV
jgi:hypothetical protein